MRIYRNKRDGFLYRIYSVDQPRANGRLEAAPCYPNQGERIEKVNLCDFEASLAGDPRFVALS